MREWLGRVTIGVAAQGGNMPTRSEVDAILRWAGFNEPTKNGRPNTYEEGGRSTPLAASWRYQHKQHSGWTNDSRGAVYVHAFEHNDDAVLVANHIYRDRFLGPNQRVVSRSGTFTNKNPPEDGYRDEALWRALIVLARETK
jgi:hypothetical protein